MSLGKAGPTGVAVLGSTGTIGDNTLDVVARHPERFRIVALAARRDHQKLLAQCRRFRPELAALVEGEAAMHLEQALRAESLPTRVIFGEAALETIAAMPEAPFVMAGIVGAAGLPSSLAAARAGKRLMIANKEPLVMAGPMLLAAARQGGATLLPIDSEHNAIFQCWPPGAASGSAPPGVRRVLLTASGGPFVDWSAAQLAVATPEQACKHPKWVMGRKISVDSATLMNKGLEVIEAHELFGVDYDRIDVVVHPQSVVHSMVTFTDGATIAQLSLPDMRLPIAYAITWPERFDVPFGTIDWRTLRRLDFESPDRATFRCLDLAYAAGRAGGSAPAWLSAANEVAVEAFLAGRITWLQIAEVNDATLQRHDDAPLTSTDDVLAADAEARRIARRLVETFAHSAGTVTA